METGSTESENEQETVIKEEVNLQFHWYLISFFMIYFGSLLIPGVIFILYSLLFFIPNVLIRTRWYSRKMNNIEFSHAIIKSGNKKELFQFSL